MNRSTKLVAAALAYVAPLCCGSFAEAQQSASSGSSGAFGARSLGSSFSPTASGFAPGGSNGLGAGMGGVAGMTTRGDNTAGQVSGNERFVRGSRRPGQFVGADNADTSNLMSQLSSMASQNQLGPQRNNNAANPNRTTGNLGLGARRVQPRVAVSVGFDYRTAGSDEAGTVLQNRFTKSSRPGLRGRVIVNLEGTTAVLRGNVATEHDRVLAEQVALLEAGVGSVRNELQVIQRENLPTQQAPSIQPLSPQSPTMKSAPSSTGSNSLRLVPPAP
ncbi:MAG: BON domain-containing protein [Planctomycetia bacterium]|nr:BON domain-containing protein [Planctomycetia bacterium]